MKQIILDASVALKWYLPDERLSHKAISFLDQYVFGELDISAPSLLEYEVINGLVIVQQRGRIDEKTVLKAIEGFINLEIKFKQMNFFYPKTLQFCRKYHLSMYDASYLALADKTRIPFVTADERLYNSVHKDFKWIRRLGEKS